MTNHDVLKPQKDELKYWLLQVIEDSSFDSPLNDGILTGIYAYEKSVQIKDITYDYHFRKLSDGIKICRIAIERIVFDDTINLRRASDKEKLEKTYVKPSYNDVKLTKLSDAIVEKLNEPDSKGDFKVILRSADDFEILPILDE